MTDFKTINIEGIGPVLLERSARARRMTITVRPHRGIRVAIPRHGTHQQAVEFVNQKMRWILKTLARIRRYEDRQKYLADALSKIDRDEAKQAIIKRLRQLSKKHGFTYNKVTIRNQRTRWGSCSARNNISLNIKAAILPGELLDYIILHELVHTRVHNHGRRFWAELDKHVGNGKKLAARLGEYDLRLM